LLIWIKQAPVSGQDRRKVGRADPRPRLEWAREQNRDDGPDGANPAAAPLPDTVVGEASSSKIERPAYLAQQQCEMRRPQGIALLSAAKTSVLPFKASKNSWSGTCV
jgi:hypothetical protein